MRTLIFDTETTDLVKNELLPLDQQPRIVEFFGTVIEELDPAGQDFHWMVNPGIKIPAEAQRITGITDEMVKDKPNFAAVAPEVVQLIGSVDCVVAHNLSYDFFVTNCALARAGHAAVWPAQRICTVEQTEWLKGFRLSLAALHEELFGEGFTDAHRAENDVRALTRCFIELCNRGYI